MLPMNETTPAQSGLTIREFQELIGRTFGAKDAARGDTATFLWFIEEVGELATALRHQDQEALGAEMADVLAWLVSLANLRGIELEAAVRRKYGESCPDCRSIPCTCDPEWKP
jgi:NTP pyrophosphatase (non-canonical NTP hydrolase)